MDSQPPPPNHSVDVLLKTAARRHSAAIRLVPAQDAMSVQFLTGTDWQEDRKIPAPLDGLVVAEIWARTRRSTNTDLRLEIDLSN